MPIIMGKAIQLAQVFCEESRRILEWYNNIRIDKNTHVVESCGVSLNF